MPCWLSRFFCRDIAAAASAARNVSTEEMVVCDGRHAIVEQLESMALDDFEQELVCRFVDESHSFGAALWHAYRLGCGSFRRSLHPFRASLNIEKGVEWIP